MAAHRKTPTSRQVISIQAVRGTADDEGCEHATFAAELC